MKFKATRKSMKENYGDRLYAVGYCVLQNLLRYEQPIAYSAGVNGWACDYYELSNENGTICVSTGYAPVGRDINYDLCREYDGEAERRPWCSRDELAEMVKDFVDAVLREEE